VQQFTTVEMLKTKQFYALYAAFVMMAAGGLFVTASQGPLAKAWGFGSVLTLTATLSPIANGASRIFWGFASDRVGRERAMVVAFLLQALCLVGVATVGRSSSTMFIVTLVLTYFTWGEVFSLFPSTSGDYFGSKHATSNYAVLYTAKGIAAIFGVSLATWLHDRTGTWTIGFFGSAGLALISAIIIFGLLRVRAARKRELAVA
jgi:OFA family oxalate/formate antiporter-like MFS transporter